MFQEEVFPYLSNPRVSDNEYFTPFGCFPRFEVPWVDGNLRWSPLLDHRHNNFSQFWWDFLACHRNRLCSESIQASMWRRRWYAQNTARNALLPKYSLYLFLKEPMCPSLLRINTRSIQALMTNLVPEASSEGVLWTCWVPLDVA